jgi:hypothetical protein
LVRYIADEEEELQTLQEPPPTAYLVLLVEGRASHSFPLRREVGLGREHDNAIVVADRKVSRHHARLTPIDKTFIISDLGSANGTYVNGVRIAQPTRLKEKDKIGVGDTLFWFTASLPASDVVIDPALSASVPAGPPAAIASSSYGSQSSDWTAPPLWILLGCMALIIVALLFVLAMLLGLFVGRSQVGLALVWWLAWSL